MTDHFTFHYDFIEKLTQINGISGHESKVAEYLYQELKDFCDEVQFDHLGSIIFVKKASIDNGQAPKVMIAAHMDQIGFLITDIDDKGFAYIKPIGGWWTTQLMTQDVCVTTEEGKEYPGVIGHKPSKELQKKEKIEFDDLFVDFGVKDKEELASFGIRIGDPITPVSAYKPLVNERYVATKAWDNRVGCAIIGGLLRAIKEETLSCDLYLAATVQEEVGLRGAKTAAQKINPDLCISIDIGSYGDTPGCKSYDSTVKLGEGPVIDIMDATALGNRKFIQFARQIANANKIPYQTDVMVNGGTDTGEMHKAYDGAVPLTISIPTRYGHSHNSIVHLDDLENAVKLLAYMTSELNEDKFKEFTTWFHL